jgi:hypothetical protein
MRDRDAADTIGYRKDPCPQQMEAGSGLTSRAGTAYRSRDGRHAARRCPGILRLSSIPDEGATVET